jgi:ribonuclease HIII
MVDKKISDLSANSSLSGSEYVELVQSGANVKALLSAVKTWVINGLATTAQAKAEYLVLAASDESTALTTGTAKVTFRMPYAMTLTSVRCSLTTAQASGSILTVDINDSGISILSTKLMIDNTEKTSTTAATAAVISDTALADDAEITIDIDQVGDGTAKGLKITLIGTRA